MRKILAMLALAILTACSTMSTGPKSTEAAVAATIAEVKAQTRILLDSNKLTYAQGREIDARADRARDIARGTATDAPSSPDARLALARAILEQTKAELIAKGATFK